jgi:prepilin-type N-terminal cleavage/methylation domain-containing protein
VWITLRGREGLWYNEKEMNFTAREEVRTMRFHRRLTMRKRERGGFTLIELLVVIAIIGILAAVVLVSLNSARVRGRDGRRLSDLQSLALAMDIYFDQHDSTYPSAGAGGCETEGPTAACFNDVVTVLSGANLVQSATMSDPLPSRSYVAEVPATATVNGFILGADLEQNNQACASDYDGADLVGTGTACAEATANNCSGAETDGVDFCIRKVEE